MPRAGGLFREIVSCRLPAVAACGLIASMAACSGRDRVASATSAGASAASASAHVADSAELASGTVPRMLNVEPPFRYPTELYARKVQGNVMLRLHVDSMGHVRPESTTVVGSSGYPSLDSAAVAGATALTFSPAVRDGHPVGRSIRFPVHFRHPDAEPIKP